MHKTPYINAHKAPIKDGKATFGACAEQGKHRKLGQPMIGKLFKLIGYLAVLCIVALIAYAYVGPYIGVDFAPEQVEIRKPVTLPLQ
ncbi:hypothetical protein ACIRQ6_08415 [Algirhabdus cladophorae]